MRTSQMSAGGFTASASLGNTKLQTQQCSLRTSNSQATFDGNYSNSADPLLFFATCRGNKRSNCLQVVNTVLSCYCCLCISDVFRQATPRQSVRDRMLCTGIAYVAAIKSCNLQKRIHRHLVIQAGTVGELARALLSFKRPTRRHRTATVVQYRLLAIFTWGQGYSKCFLSQISKPYGLICNTLFYDSVGLKDPHGQLIRFLVSECDDCESCDVTSMTSVT